MKVRYRRAKYPETILGVKPDYWIEVNEAGTWRRWGFIRGYQAGRSSGVTTSWHAYRQTEVASHVWVARQRLLSHLKDQVGCIINPD